MDGKPDRNGWIKCSERMPDYSLVLGSDGRQIAMVWGGGGQWTQVNTWIDMTGKILYWHPLPDPPEES